MNKCYLHPTRDASVSCARCGQPICTECMISAPVGFQCPECVRSARPRVVQVGNSQLPRVTRAIITTCVAVFVLGNLLGFSALSAENLGMWPRAIAAGEWYRLMTSAFLHGGWLHIGFNMYALYYFGPPLEEYLGRFKFITLYGMAALGGGVASYFFSPVDTLSVGASGAIFGLMAALLVLGRTLGIDTSQLLLLFVVNVLIGFSGGIDWRAHFGGAIVGAVVASQLGRPRPQWAVVAGVLALLLAMAVARSGSLG